jgi:excisionase family DNA binding protein
LDEGIGEYLTIFELSKLTKFKVPTLRKYVLTRKIPYHKINRAIRFKPDEIKAWLAAGGASGGKKTGGAVGGKGKAGKPEEQGELPFEGRT